jgi:16S rRNA (uracil1498-N3)-methyltransferase
MSGRYFVESAITADRVLLTGPEAHHLARVMRATPGSEVVLFDGSGAEFSARITNVGRSTVELQIVQRRQVDRELPIAIHLGVALPKGDRQRWLIEKSVELGVRRLVPLTTVRGVAQPVQQALVRLRRSVVEASKQCGRNRLMEIVEPCSFGEFLVSAPRAATRLVAHPHDSAKPLAKSDLLAIVDAGGVAVEDPASDSRELSAEGRGAGDLRSAVSAGSETRAERERGAERENRAERAVYLAVGPEGGFTDEEIGLAEEAAWQAVCLGPRTLRIETAAIALVSLVAMLSETATRS